MSEKIVCDVKGFPQELKDKMISSGITEDEVKLIEAWRFINFGKMEVWKKDGKMSGRIDIKVTY